MVVNSAVESDRKPQPVESRSLRIRALQAMNALYVKSFHRLDVHSPCNLPRTGPGILICNHTSGLDPLLIQALCSRVIVWMMDEEFYNMPSLKWAFQMIEAIPVSGSGRDTSATRSAIRALRSGRILGIFPEGRIERERVLLPFQDGVTLMALKTGAPVYPVALDGTQRNIPMTSAFSRPQAGSITFGEVIELNRTAIDKSDLKSQTQLLESAVGNLLDKLLIKRGL